MSKIDVKELRQAIGTSRPLAAAVRERARAYARQRKSEGASQQSIAQELGLSQFTISRWVRGRESSGALVPVEVVSRRELTARSGPVTVITPRGLRVEGLDIDALCMLVARVG